MLEKYNFIRQLGSGSFGIVDLYERSGIKYVLKTQLLLNREVKNINNNLTLNTTRFDSELAFNKLVNLMPNEESKYFRKLISYDIRQNEGFDKGRLRELPTNLTTGILSDINNSPPEELYIIRLLYTYAGDKTIESYIKEMMEKRKVNYKFITKLADDLVKIVSITRKYKWSIDGFHTDNMCFNGKNVVLIDYGHMKYISDDIDASEKWLFNVNIDYWDIIVLMTNRDYIFNTDGGSFVAMPNEFLIKLAQTIISSKHYGRIKNYITKVISSDLLESMQMLEKGDYQYISEVIYFMGTLWLISDKKSYWDFYSENYPYKFIKNTPQLYNSGIINKLLNNYKK